MTDKAPMIGTFINLSAELHDDAVNTAAECGASLSGFCREAVRFYLEHLENEARSGDPAYGRARQRCQENAQQDLGLSRLRLQQEGDRLPGHPSLFPVWG